MANCNRLAVSLFIAAWLAVSIGCDKSESTSSSPPPGPDVKMGPEPTGPHAAGNRVFNSQGCARCHSIGEDSAGGKGKKRMGPDLASVARDPEHTPEWLAEYIRDPKSTNPTSRMPPFQAKINEEDFKHLIDYLSSLK